jgi:hypothetical protein
MLASRMRTTYQQCALERSGTGRLHGVCKHAFLPAAPKRPVLARAVDDKPSTASATDACVHHFSRSAMHAAADAALLVAHLQLYLIHHVPRSSASASTTSSRRDSKVLKSRKQRLKELAEVGNDSPTPDDGEVPDVNRWWRNGRVQRAVRWH